MKKCMCFLWLMPLAALSQLKTGNVLIAPAGFYNRFSQNLDDTTRTNVQSSRGGGWTGVIRLGYFVTDRIVMGLSGTYARNHWTSENGQPFMGRIISTHTDVSFGYGIFARAYFPFAEGRLALFGQVDIWRSSLTTEDEYESENSFFPMRSGTIQRADGYDVNLTPGVAWFLGKRFAVEASIGGLSYMIRVSKLYNHDNTYIGSGRSSQLNLNAARSFLSLGFSFYPGIAVKAD